MTTKQGLYAYFDKVSGQFSPLYAWFNDAQALRAYEEMLIRTNSKRNDISLFLLGTYDSSQGDLQYLVPTEVQTDNTKEAMQKIKAQRQLNEKIQRAKLEEKQKAHALKQQEMLDLIEASQEERADLGSKLDQ